MNRTFYIEFHNWLKAGLITELAKEQTYAHIVEIITIDSYFPFKTIIKELLKNKPLIFSVKYLVKLKDDLLKL